MSSLTRPRQIMTLLVKYTFCFSFNAPINVKPTGGEAGLGVGIRHFFIFFCQMPHHRAAECGQMQLKIPTLGTNLMVNSIWKSEVFIDQSLSLSLFIQYLINTYVIIKPFCCFRQKIIFVKQNFTDSSLTSAILPCAMTYLRGVL